MPYFIFILKLETVTGIIVCLSDHRVPKEWIFQCITDGAVLSTNLFHRERTSEPNYVSESDAESSVVSFKGLKGVPIITIQSTRFIRK